MRLTVVTVAWFSLILTPGVGQAQELEFRVDLRLPDAEEQVVDAGGAAVTVSARAGERSAYFDLAVVLSSALEPCVSDPTACDGSENFIDETAMGAVYGCADGLDNDGDGQSDADDPDCQGVQGWTVSLDPDECFDVGNAATSFLAGDITLRGGWRDPESGFEKTGCFLGECSPGFPRIVSAVVLSLSNPVILPQVGEFDVLRVVGSMDISSLLPGETTEPCAISFVPLPPEPRPAVSDPIGTAVTVGGVLRAPALRNLTLQVRSDEEAEMTWHLDVVSPAATAGEEAPLDAMTGVVQWTIDDASASLIDLQVRLSTRLEDCVSRPQECDGGERFVTTDMTGTMRGCGDGIDNDGDGLVDGGDPDCFGVQGWAVNVASTCLRFTQATTEGTAAGLEPDGLRPIVSYERTALFNSTDGGTSIAASAVVLSLTDPVILPPVGESIVLRLSGGLTASDGSPCRVDIPEETPECGACEPVQTIVTVGGACDRPRRVHAEIVTRPGEFRRGDANQDHRVDVADAVWLLRYLFGDGAMACGDAADSNDDARVDLADVAFITEYRFGNGRPPPAPFSDCGPDPTPDDLRCVAACEKTL